MQGARRKLPRTLAGKSKEDDVSQEVIEREFAVVVPARLTVTNIRGAVDVQPGDDGVVTITAVKHLDTGDPDRTMIKIRQAGDGSVTVETRFRNGNSRGRRRPCKVDYTVRLPRACVLGVRCVSSSTLLQGLEGEFDLETVSGPVSLEDISGEIKVTSVSGDIIGERLSGPMKIESVSGEVRLTESHLSAITGSSVSGDLVLQTVLGAGPYGFETVSGDVRLALPPGAGCTVEMKSLSGRLKTSLPVTRSQRRRWKLHADLQGGGPKVRFSSVSGNLSVM